MTGTRIIIAAVSLLIVGLMAFYGLRSCTKQPEPVTPAKSVQAQQQLESDNRTAEALHQQQAAFEQRILKAIDEALAKKEAEHIAATERALQSALKFKNQPTLANCTHALQDCQHENQAKAAVIGTQQEKISSLSRTVKADSSEINRQRMAIGLYNANLKDCNERWQQTSEELLKAKKPKRIGIGFQVGYGLSDGLQPKPYIGGGISYNFVRF